MSTPPTARSARDVRRDHAALVLLRLVSDPEDDDFPSAARRLREEVPDERLLRLLQVRVAAAMLQRSTPIDRRALAVLELAVQDRVQA